MEFRTILDELSQKYDNLRHQIRDNSDNFDKFGKKIDMLDI
jgi:hypothetical protein